MFGFWTGLFSFSSDSLMFLQILKKVFMNAYIGHKEVVGITAKHLCECFFSFIFLFSPNGE